MRQFLIILIVGVLAVLAPILPGAPHHNVAYAQTEAPDYAAWSKVANRAEIALSDQRASDKALESLRADLVGWRIQFTAAQDVNSARIATLKTQIAALGDAPADVETVEPSEISELRTELTARLALLDAPRLVAVEAYQLANGLIGEVDTIIRERTKARLFELGPSPLNPALWPVAIGEIATSLGEIGTELETDWNSVSTRTALIQNLPTTAFYFVVAMVFLLRSRTWMVRLTSRIQGDMSSARPGFYGFVASLGQLLFPILGVYALAEAFYSSGLLGFRGQLIADGLIPIGIAFFGARWLSLRLMPMVRHRQGFLRISDDKAGTVRWYGAVLGLIWGANQLVTRLGMFDAFEVGNMAVLRFPLILIAGVILYRVGQVLRQGIGQKPDDAELGWTFGAKVSGLLAQALMVAGVLGPLAAAIGYASAASLLVFSSILTLGIIGLLVISSGVTRDLYALVLGKTYDQAQQSLVPILISFALVLVSLPFLALIWGARVADISELWTRFQEGVSIGDTQISPSSFLMFALVFSVGYMATRLLQSTLRTSVLPKTGIDPGGQSAIVSGLGYVGIFLAALIAISTAGIDLSSLAIVAGALSVGIGFGLQNIVSNFVAGIILLIERPITEGDWISVGGHEGTVRDISVRSTRIETFNRTDVIIPNADFVSGAVTNYTRGNVTGRAVISVGVAYGSDTRQVQEILQQAALVHPLVARDPPPGVHLVNFGADSLDFQIRAILHDVNSVLTVKSEILHEINRRFAEEGIEIPFAQRDVWLRNPETLNASEAAAETSSDKS